MRLKSKQFIEYIRADLDARKQHLNPYYFVVDPITRFHWYLRLLEFLQTRLIFMPIFIVIKFLFLRLSQRLGFSIPINTLGKGVYLPHWGPIVINSKAKVGANCVIHVDVVIGQHPSSKLSVPEIGRSVYIAPGVKLFGDIKIGDYCVIRANSVVSKSMKSKSLIVGIPGEIIKQVSEKMLLDYGLK